MAVLKAGNKLFGNSLSLDKLVHLYYTNLPFKKPKWKWEVWLTYVH